MKRFITVLSGLLVMPAFAEVAPVIYEDVIEYSDTEMFDADDVVEQEIVSEEPGVMIIPPVGQVRTVSRSTSGRASRALPKATTRATSPSRAIASRAAANISQTRNVMTRGTASRAGVSRAATSASSQTVSSRRASQPSESSVVARAGSIVQTDTVNTPLYTGRVGVRAGGAASSIRARVPTVRINNSSNTTATTVTATPATVEEVTTSMDQLAQMTDFCKAQYTECMDNFCNVLDDNQGRCSCSKNIKNYAKTEEALKEATVSLQDVAQKIQYIGLTKDEINTLFDQTEAEQAMQGNSDSSQIENDLDKIKNMIVDVKSGTASSSETAGISMDLSGLLDFNIDNTGFDLGSLFGTNTTNTNSISNQRGEELYKTAAARCKTAVLNDCQKQGVEISIITNSYDMEIDKQCIAYERSLTDANDQMLSTVRNAKAVLQKARLMVAQQKNSYDLRGCVNALDSCMQDDFVCGTDYENCLDPTGKYIVNGEVVIGSTPGQTLVKVDAGKETVNEATQPQLCPNTELYAVWNYTGDDSATNAWCGAGNIANYVEKTLAEENPTKIGKDMTGFLTYKIGYNDNGKNFGMCISVLNKCQAYTYDANGEYIPDNDVIKEYLRRTLTQIKVAQDQVIADHAENCISEVSSCLNQNGYSETATGDNANNVAINSCRASILTCMSVNGDATDGTGIAKMKDWITNMLGLSTSTSN